MAILRLRDNIALLDGRLCEHDKKVLLFDYRLCVKDLDVYVFSVCCVDSKLKKRKRGVRAEVAGRVASKG